MEEYRPTHTEMKKNILKVLEIERHPLAKTLSAGVAKLSPWKTYDRKAIEKIHEQDLDEIVNKLRALPENMEEIHRLVKVVGAHAPHRFLEANELSKELERGVLKKHAEHVNKMIDVLEKLENQRIKTHMADTLVNILQRARSDVEFRERLKQIADIYERCKRKDHVNTVLENVLYGTFGKVYGIALIDALQEDVRTHELDKEKLRKKLAYLVKISNILSEIKGADPVKAAAEVLNEPVSTRNFGTIPLKDIILMGLTIKKAGDIAIKELKKRVGRRRHR